MKWRSETTYVDNETGEEVHKKKIKNGEYLKLKHTTKTIFNDDKNGIKIGTRLILWECKKNNQLRLF